MKRTEQTHTERVTFRLPTTLAQRMDEDCVRMVMCRSDYIREAIQRKTTRPRVEMVFVTDPRMMDQEEEQ